MPAPRPLVTIENSLLDAMLADAGIRDAFTGCLAPLVESPAKPCGSCGGRARRAREAYDAAKACLARLDDTGRRRLKESLNAAQIQIVVAADAGSAPGGPTTYRF